MEPLVLVVPASGGLGASTFAAVLARQVSGVLVDGDVEGAGVDATLVLEDEPGLRWPDLAGLEGPAEPRHLLARLPGSAPPVLAGAGPTRVRSAVVGSALAALRAQRPVVVDLPAPVLDRHDWLAWADLVVLLAGLRPRQVRDAEVTLRRVRDGAATVRLVTRGARRAEPVGREVADHLGGAWLGHLEDEPGVLRDEGRGRPPRSRGAVGRVARTVAEVLPPATADEGGEPRWLGWFPSSGIVEPSEDFLGALYYAFLPSLALGLGLMAHLTRMTRSTMTGILGQEFIRVARAKGLTERTVIWRYALANAIGPVITIAGLQIGYLFGSIIVMESLFGYTGMGWLTYQALLNRDLPLIQATVFVIAAVVMITNLLVDLLYVLIDPRVKLG